MENLNAPRSSQVLLSNVDKSVNFVEQQLIGFIESRYVRRTDDYFIAYLSSQTGCNRGCKMCHLTATRQTQFTNCDLQDFADQLETVFVHYDRDTPAKYMHINWMARGEPLANPTVVDTSSELLIRLGNMARERQLPVKFNISTIMPKTMRKSLVEIFPFIHPTIYYSIYSVNDSFREKWLPGAMPPLTAIKQLKEYQQLSKKIIKFHCAFIDGENDSAADVNQMISLIMDHNINAEFNIVRYNPFSLDQGEESQCLPGVYEQISKYIPCKIIPRVGQDVYASCGTFIG